jgi:preprotein translocase subunit SecD
MARILSTIVILALTGYATMLGAQPKMLLEFRPCETSATAGFTPMTSASSDQTVYVSQEAVLSNEDIASARVQNLKGGDHWIAVVFTEVGAKKFANATENSLNKPLGILVDGKLICAPIVREKVVDGNAVISGKFTQEEAERIANGILEK